MAGGSVCGMFGYRQRALISASSDVWSVDVVHGDKCKAPYSEEVRHHGDLEVRKIKLNGGELDEARNFLLHA